MNWLPVISLLVSVIGALLTIGGMVYFGGKLHGRFEGHENTDNVRFNSITSAIAELKVDVNRGLGVVQEDIKTLLSR
jgi:hypothetical protein